MQVVRSISELRAIKNKSVLGALTLGYFAVGDGGGSTYYNDPLDTTSQDDGGRCIVAFDGGRWKISQTDVISVKQFGAVGNAQVDDTRAIQNAIFAYSNVRMPKGTYLISSPLFLNGGKRVFGDSQIETTLLLKNEFNGFQLTNTNTYGIEISNMAITSLGKKGTGMRIDSPLEVTAHMKLTNIRFASLKNGIVGDTTKAFLMFDSTLDKIDFIDITDTALLLAGSQNNIVGCTFRLCQDVAVRVGSTTGGAGGGIFSGCTFIANGKDISFETEVIRPLAFYRCWFEQTVDISVGITLNPITFTSLLFSACLWQPSATAQTLIFDEGIVRRGLGIVTCSDCVVYTDLNASARLPNEDSVDVGRYDIKYNCTNCMQIQSGGTVSLIKDISTNSFLNVANYLKAKQYSDDSAAQSDGLVNGDVYWNTSQKSWTSVRP